MNLLFEFPVAASLAACIMQFGSAWKTVTNGRKSVNPSEDEDLPAVSILKPLKGVDDRLLDNMESFCRLDYPRYEIIFCVQGASDPALRVARRVKETHPEREIAVVVGDSQEGLNPKVNNMMAGYSAARYPFILISDSNVAPAPGYLREAAGHFRDPSVGLVSHLVRGTGAKTLGARLENQHLNTFILPSVSLLDRMFGIPCVVGKSMLMRRDELDAMGGLVSVKDYLAEDYVIGEMFRKAGKRVVISGSPVDNVNVYRSLRQFLSRHARWNRMRFSIAGAKYFAELFTNPVALSLLMVTASPGDAEVWTVAGGVLAAKMTMDYGMQRMLGDRSSPGWILLGPIRDALAAGLWFSAFFSQYVEWRGRTFRITRGSRLVPVGEDAGLEPAAEGVR
jgi:ceramide glucosyltransferase